MERRFELCHGCWNTHKEFKEWSPAEDFNAVTPDRRREFWEYAAHSLKKECVELGYADYPTYLCYDCCKDIVEDWAKYLGIPLWKVFG